MQDLYQLIGIIVVVIFAIGITFRVLSVQNRIIREGMTSGGSSGSGSGGSSDMTDREHIGDAVRLVANHTSDGLLVNKYRSSYEHAIVELDRLASLSILDGVVHNAEKIASDPMSDASQKIIGRLNEMKKFRDTLSVALDTLDKQ